MKSTKCCARCNQEKARNAFSEHKANSEGLQSYCKVCQRLAMKAWREKNALKQKQYHERYREANREQRREYNRQWREQNRVYQQQSKKYWLYR